MTEPPCCHRSQTRPAGQACLRPPRVVDLQSPRATSSQEAAPQRARRAARHRRQRAVRRHAAPRSVRAFRLCNGSRLTSLAEKWVQIAPAELQAAADAMRGRPNGARTHPANHHPPALHATTTRPPRSLPPPVPPLPTPASVDDVFVVRSPNHIQRTGGSSANASSTSTTSPSSSLASLGPPQTHTTRRSPSLSATTSSSQPLTTQEPPAEPPVVSTKRVAPAQAEPVSVSAFRDREHIPALLARVVFGSLGDPFSETPSAVIHGEQETEQAHQPQQGDVPGDPTSVTVGDAAATAAGHLTALSLDPSVSPAYHPAPAWYPPPDPWQLPAAAWHQLPPPMPYTNGVMPETDMQQQQEPRALSDSDRNWSGSSWHAAQQYQAAQYADGTPVPYTGYYYQPPPRHAASHYSHGHHSHHSSQWDHALSPTLDAWEDRERHPRKERKEKDKEREREREASSRDVFEVDYSRAAPVVVAVADRRPREKERERDRDRDREKDSAPRPRRNSAASGSFFSGPRRGRSHSQPFEGGSTRGRGAYRGAYHRERTYTASSARALSPEASTPSSSVHFGGGGAYHHGGHSGRGGGRQQSHPGELPLPLPVPQTLIKSVSQMDATKYFVLGQIEFYFGARNLATDFFLRQQMDSRGWIPIPLVASFNRVRALSTSGALVREVMGLSALLEVKGDRVRLRDGLWMPYVTPDALPSTVISDDEDDKPSVLASSVAEVTEDDTDDLDEDDEDDDIVFVMT
ncbi:hypothetical protein EXIGLDRAFT_220095 [Exidia glandulosa HHB12029]|uniref:HTH La-type RNA-binding domain-containing protein n=1 Tax=Exidia glandulosa HHB12029 TaxID=1314781 RepID=A0A165MP41_EXIGL|nr:hypothetical protein EXIGLDRAFT_220095 [Exidia glandulosa HHB12029]